MKTNARQLGQQTTDPLLRSSNRKVYTDSLAKEFEGPNRARKVVQLAVKCFVPFASFLVMILFVVFMFYDAPILTWFLYGMMMAVALSYTYVVDHCMKKQTWARQIGMQCALATTVAFAIGGLIHYNYMLYYHKYKTMMRYSNVAASQSVLQFEDAGWLLFTEGTKVDTTRAVGYRNLRTSQTLCVAPVVDSQMSPSDPIVFWAVGNNCCNWRASFNCDDAKSGGRNGLLVLEPHNLVSDSMEWIVKDHFDKEGFTDAISLGESVFAMSAGKDIRFVRWLADPEKTINAYRNDGSSQILYASILYVAVATIYIMQEIAKDELRQRKYIAKKTFANEEDL